MKKQSKFNILAIIILLLLLMLIHLNEKIVNNETVPQQNEIQKDIDLEKREYLSSLQCVYTIKNDLYLNNNIVNTIAVEDKTETQKYKEVNIVISHYSDLPEENGIYGAVDCQGNKLIYGTIAAPYDIPLGAVFIIDGYECEFTVRDRGSRKYIKWLDENTIKIDMFIPRKKGESDVEYRKRISDLGIIKTKGKYLLPNES